MRLSVILTTFNQPEWLEKSLWGYATQDTPPDEIIVADDGSDARTHETIRRIAAQLRVPLTHVWHEDRGFQKCRILNKAILAAEGDYLLFSDGDCVPRRDFVAQHRLHARPGRFLSGGCHKLPLDLSQRVTIDDIRTGRAFDYAWLRAEGLPLTPRALRLAVGGGLAAKLDAATTTRPTWNGSNASGWARDVRGAGGFDERMRYGGLDRELGERLENAGVAGKQVRHRAICLHLEHARDYESADDWRRNNEIRIATRVRRSTFTVHGLNRAA